MLYERYNMNQLIKNIRTYLNMSQAEFAEKYLRKGTKLVVTGRIQTDGKTAGLFRINLHR